MSTTGEHEAAPLNVHVKSTDVPPAAAPEVTASFSTLVLTAQAPVQLLMGRAPNREYAIVQSLDNDVVLSYSRGEAGSAANTADSSLAVPQGAVIPVGVVVPLRQANEVWVAAASYPSRVSLIAAYREDG